MKRYLVSGSRLPLISACAAAGVLPQVMSRSTKADIGSALHEHILQDRLRLGIDDAVLRLPELAERHELSEQDVGLFIWRAKTFTWSPPKKAISEIALALCEDGSVERVKGGRGVYTSLPPGAILPTQIDCIWAEPEPLYVDDNGRVRCPEDSLLTVLDLKCGKDVYVESVERNAQTLGALVIAARWTGAKKAVPMICYVEPGPGVWDAPEHYLDEERLDRAETIVRSWTDAVQEQGRALEDGRPLTFTEGSHCTYCAARSFCTAKTATLRRILDDPAPLAGTQLTPDQARRLAELSPQISQLAKQATEALKDYVQATGRPIPLSNGKLWGPHAHDTTVIDPDVAAEVLAEELGDDSPHIREAVRLDVSRASLQEAIRASHREQGITKMLSRAMARVMSGIKARGGITKETTTWYSMFSPVPEEPVRRALPPGVPVDGDDVEDGA